MFFAANEDNEDNEDDEDIENIIRDSIYLDGFKNALNSLIQSEGLSKVKISSNFLLLLNFSIKEINSMLATKYFYTPKIDEDLLDEYENIKYLYDKQNNTLNLVIASNKNYFDEIEDFISKYLDRFSKTIDSVFHDIKNNFLLINEISKIEDLVQEYETEYVELENYVTFNNVQNFSQYIKLMKRYIDLCKIFHNESIDLSYIDLLFNNLSIDLKQNYIEDLITILEFKKDQKNNIIKLEKISQAFKEKGFDLNIEDFNKNLEKINRYIDSFYNKTLVATPEFVLISKSLGTDLSYGLMHDALVKYIGVAKPKDENLFKLDLSFDDYEFKVLKYLDPLHFRIGIETNCCQRLNGKDGEEAAIDSFINPLAGVLVLYKNGNILSQSYFHFVPEDNGYILDNIEYNLNEVKKYDDNIKDQKSDYLVTIYKKYGELLQEKNPEIKYVKIGKKWTKISLDSFKQSSMKKDPRKFSTKEIYTDFSFKDHVDLFSKN